jgi:hypothetical protein
MPLARALAISIIGFAGLDIILKTPLVVLTLLARALAISIIGFVGLDIIFLLALCLTLLFVQLRQAEGLLLLTKILTLMMSAHLHVASTLKKDSKKQKRIKKKNKKEESKTQSVGTALKQIPSHDWVVYKSSVLQRSVGHKVKMNKITR